MLRFGEIWVLFPFWGLLDHESGNRQQTEDITTKHIVSRRQEQTTFCDSKSFESSLVICSVLFCSVSICETQSSFLGDKLKQGKKNHTTPGSPTYWAAPMQISKHMRCVEVFERPRFLIQVAQSPHGLSLPQAHKLVKFEQFESNQCLYKVQID